MIDAGAATRGAASPTTARTRLARGPRRGARRRGRRPRLARPAARGEGIAPLPLPAAGRPVRPVRRVPVPHPDVRPGAPAARRLPPRRGRPPRLDGPVRRHARDPGRAAGLVPRQRAVDLHVALARAADPPARRLAAGLARRGRDRAARGLGARGHRQRRRLRPDARGHRQRAAGPDRAVPGRAGPSSRCGSTPPIVPLAIAGTEELYLGRRLASRVLPATTARALAGLDARRAAAARGHARGARRSPTG